MNYPSFMWGFDGELQCGRHYDPRMRPWYVSAAASPKNEVLMLDNSKTMNDGISSDFQARVEKAGGKFSCTDIRVILM